MFLKHFLNEAYRPMFWQRSLKFVFFNLNCAHFIHLFFYIYFPGGCTGKKTHLTSQFRRYETRFKCHPWIRKIPWRSEWQPSILAWRIPWTEEPGGLQSIGSQRVRHDRSNLSQHSTQHVRCWWILCICKAWARRFFPCVSHMDRGELC